MQKLGLVVEGGGMRGAYSAGVLDAFIDAGLRADYCIGVSAGAANLASYVAGQRQRSYRFYHDYIRDWRFLSLASYLTSGDFFGLHYIYGTLSNPGGRDPLDLAAIRRNPCEWLTGATDAATGAIRWFTKDDFREGHLEPLMASSSIPFFCRPVKIGGRLYYDGGTADQIPVRKAYEDGCDFIITILSRQRHCPSHEDKLIRLYPWLLRKYPKTVAKLTSVDQRHDAAQDFAYRLQEQGKGLVIAPSATVEVRVATKDQGLLRQLYDLGLADGKKAADYLNKTYGL